VSDQSNGASTHGGTGLFAIEKLLRSKASALNPISALDPHEAVLRVYVTFQGRSAFSAMAARVV